MTDANPNTTPWVAPDPETLAEPNAADVLAYHQQAIKGLLRRVAELERKVEQLTAGGGGGGARD